MPVFRLTDLDDSRLLVYRELKGRPTSRQGDWFVVEGTKTVARLLDSDFPTASVLLTERRVEEWLPRIPPDVPVYVLSDEQASELVGFNFHTGVVACGQRRPSPRLEDVLDRSSDRITLVVCPSCDNPENLGAIIRIAAGFGAAALLLGSACCDPFSRRVLRVSMGTALRLPLIESRRLERDLLRLRDEWQFSLTATVLDTAATPLHQAPRPPRLALLLGNEDRGLEPEWRALSDQQVTIPMTAGVDSLNVAIAAGICLYHYTQGP